MFFQQLLEMNGCCALNETEELCGNKSKVILFKNKTQIKRNIMVRYTCQEAKGVNETIDL